MALVQLLFMTSLFMTSLWAVAETVKIQTFNAGLTTYIANYRQRLQAVARAMRNGDYDVMCLQEVWYGDDVAKIERKLDDDIFTYTPPLFQETMFWGWANAPPCHDDEALPALACILVSCTSYVGNFADVVGCAVNCGLLSLSQTCISCLVYSATGDSGVQPTRCFNYLRREAINVPGLMLLSKKRVTSIKTVYFEPGVKQFSKRAYIQAEIEGVGTVFCSHSTSNVSMEYYEPNLRDKYTSFAEQNLADSRQLTAAALKTNKPLIMGDLNTGPAVPAFNVTEDLEVGYIHFLSEGFTSPYVDLVGRCTFCVNNPLVGSSWEVNNLIDHVLVLNHTVLSAKRLYVDNIRRRDFPMSDHYGVEIEIEN